jgi:hypothetical protein
VIERFESFVSVAFGSVLDLGKMEETKRGPSPDLAMPSPESCLPGDLRTSPSHILGEALTTFCFVYFTGDV